MDRSFVEQREQGFYLVGSRVPLDCIVWEYRKGEQAEAIRAHYPTLSLEQVYGAITFYLGHKDEVDTVMAERERVEDAFSDAHPTASGLSEKWKQRLRQELPEQRE